MCVRGVYFKAKTYLRASSQLLTPRVAQAAEGGAHFLERLLVPMMGRGKGGGGDEDGRVGHLVLTHCKVDGVEAGL